MAVWIIVWLLVITIISIAALVTSLRLMSRQSRMLSPPYPPGHGPVPQAPGYRPSPPGYGAPVAPGYGAPANQPRTDRGAYPQAPNEQQLQQIQMKWRRRSRCDQFNTAD
jgi:hypothetical protein